MQHKIYASPRFNPDGVAVYPMRKTSQPPPDMVGYQRRGAVGVDAFIFIPLWPECSRRQKQLIQHDDGCRCVKIVTTCNVDGERIDLKSCQNCSKLKSQEAPVELSGGQSISEGVMMLSEGDTETIAESPEAETLEMGGPSLEDIPVIDTQC